MVKKLRVLNKRIADERGQVFILTLILLLLGSLLIFPLLAFMATGLKTGMMYENKTSELYAADAGIEDALWQIKYENINTFKSPTFPADYSPYDFTDNWSYLLPIVNNKNVNVTIQNMWIPKGITEQYAGEASAIINNGKLLVTGTTVETSITLPDSTKISKYQIKVTYNKGAGETLAVKTLGIWLPRGFEYYSDSTHKSTLAENVSAPYYKAVPASEMHAGNQALLWEYSPSVDFTSFPNVHIGDIPLTMEVTFYFKPIDQNQPNKKPDAVAWIETTGVSDIPYSWDADVKVYKMTSVAGSTTVESYISKSEIRKMQATITGDYYATGKTLMKGVDPYANQRELLLTYSDSSINSLPTTNVTVELAYLYWSGWLNQPLTGSNPSVGVFWDNCNNLAFSDSNCKWTSGSPSSWSVYGTSEFDYQFRGHYSSGGTNAKYLKMKSNVDLTGVSSATIRWKQAAVANSLPEQQVWRDTCTSSNLTDSWQNGGDWTYDSGSGTRYRGRHYPTSGRTEAWRYLTLKNPVPLNIYGSTGTIRVTWSLSKSGTLVSSDGLDFEYSLNGGTSWTNNQVFRGNNPPSNPSYTIASVSLPNNFMIRFKVIGCTSSSKYVNIDNITIYVTPNPSDTLYFDLSNDGGNTWSRNLAFVGGNPTTDFSYSIPSAYWNSQFKMRFYFDGFEEAGEYVNLDDICIMVESTAITAKPADTSVTFIINGNSQIITADPGDPEEVQSATVLSNGTPDGYYYACRTDVTSLVKNYSNGADTYANPPVYGNGNGDYTVADVYADCKRADGGMGIFPWDGTYGASSYAGWSLVIIYSSPYTKGHQLYLYDLKDTFRSVPSTEQNSTPIQISGFVVPQQIAGETDVARLTIFVGEGDIALTGDYIAFVDQHDPAEHVLWDGTLIDSRYNVWNGRSTENPGASEAGIDIDTFHILWADGQLLEGDTSAQIKLHTYGDGYVVIYKIISFRSATTTGGALQYLIR